MARRQSILTSLFTLPQPPRKTVYYHSLLAELCRLSPSTIAPAMGKCVRKLYAGLGAETPAENPVLDAEGVRRFAEWFAIHLSNFRFHWRWNEW
jgi:nuclear cap-binding protein subunit 1